MPIKKLKAPAGHHWMKKGKFYKLMKHTGKFKPHKGATLTASLAGSKGGPAGKWSARKAQMVAKLYKAQGGGYR